MHSFSLHCSHIHQQMSFESFLPQSLFLSPFINSHHGFLLQHGLRLLRLLGFQAASLLEVENIHLLDGEAKTESFFKFYQKMCSRTVHIQFFHIRHSLLNTQLPPLLLASRTPHPPGCLPTSPASSSFSISFSTPLPPLTCMLRCK